MNAEDMPEGFPIEKAKDWIGRWKAAGGGFFCHPQPTGEVMVQLAYQGDESDPQTALDRINPIQDELLGNPDLKSAVTTLVADAWSKSNVLLQGVQGNA